MTMKYPNLSEEQKLWRQGFDFVIGLDEAGRGPLAGPVVAGAVLLEKNFNSQKFKDLKEINDSKKLSEKRRKELYKILISHSQISWGVGVVSEKTIDKINILEATKLAMKKAIDDLDVKNVDSEKVFLMLDGNFKIKVNHNQKSIIKGDQRALSIAMASIVAKVYRDSLMLKFDKKYPAYGFIKHKGYGTKHHYEMLKKYGPSVIHRKTFDLFH